MVVLRLSSIGLICSALCKASESEFTDDIEGDSRHTISDAASLYTHICTSWCMLVLGTRFYSNNSYLYPILPKHPREKKLYSTPLNLLYAILEDLSSIRFEN